MTKLYSIKSLRPLLPLDSTVAPLRGFFYPLGGADDCSWMFRYVVDSIGFWFQKNDRYMSPYANGFSNSEIAGVSGLNLDDLELVPFESNALQHPEVDRHPFRYGLPGGEPILPLPFTAREFFDWAKKCLQDELLGNNEVRFQYMYFADDDRLAELETTNPESAELARICLSGVRPEQQAATLGPASLVQAKETKEQRQDRRLRACIDAGLPMNEKAAGLRLPDGVGKVAETEGVKRQTFSTDVKAALTRRDSAKREGVTVHRT